MYKFFFYRSQVVINENKFLIMKDRGKYCFPFRKIQGTFRPNENGRLMLQILLPLYMCHNIPMPVQKRQNLCCHATTLPSPFGKCMFFHTRFHFIDLCPEASARGCPRDGGRGRMKAQILWFHVYPCHISVSPDLHHQFLSFPCWSLPFLCEVAC